ncbi:MAG: PspC domain-containing protein [Dermatophilaceae bacterium]
MPSTTDTDSLLGRLLDWVGDLGVVRRADDRWIAGVCSGVGRRLGIDPVVVRVAVVMATLLSGLGLVAYAFAYLLLPTEGEAAPLARAQAAGTPAIALLAGLGLLAVAGVGVGFSGVDAVDWSNGSDVVPLLLLGFVGYRIATGRGLLARRRGRGPAHRTRSSAPATRDTARPPAPMPVVDPAVPQYGPPVLIPNPPMGSYAAPAHPTASIPAHATSTTIGPASAGPARPAARATTDPTAHAKGTPPVHDTATPAVVRRTAGGTFASGRPSVAAPPKPRRGRHRRLGPTGTVVALGGGLAAYAIAVLVHPGTGAADVTIGLGAALGFLGVVLLVAGALGRRGGLIALVAVLLAVTTAASAAGGRDALDDGVGTRAWAVTGTSPTAYRLGVGEASLDLTGLPASSGKPIRITAHVGAGQLQIVVPADRTVRVTGRIGAGVLTEASTDIASSDPPDALLLDHTVGTGTTDAEVVADVGVGAVQIVRKAPTT